jgi:hypothetical protein
LTVRAATVKILRRPISPPRKSSLRLHPQSTAHFYRFHARSSDGKRVPNTDGELWFVQHHEWIREVWELKLELVRSLLKEDRRPCGSQFRHVVRDDWEESPVTIFVRQVLGKVEEVVEREMGDGTEVSKAKVPKTLTKSFLSEKCREEENLSLWSPS